MEANTAITEGEGSGDRKQLSAFSRSKTTKPGRKRLFVVLSILLSFIFGLPFLLKSTEIYRTPLPFTSIEEQTAHVMSSSLVLCCYFHFVFTGDQSLGESDDSILQILGKAASTISDAMHSLIDDQNYSHGGCGTSFTVMVSLDTRGKCLRAGIPDQIPIWPCGLMESGLFEVLDQSDLHKVDEFLYEFSQRPGTVPNNSTLKGDLGGLYTILNINGLSNGNDGSLKNLFKKQKDLQSGFDAGMVLSFLNSESSAVVGKYRHAWITGFNKVKNILEKDVEMMGSIAVRFFMNGGSFEQQNRISTEDKGENMPLAADGKAILSFSLLNAEPRDWIFDWDFNELEKSFWSPVVKALQPVADLALESQVLYYTPKAVRSSWDSSVQAHVVQSKDLPFFVNANEWHLDTSSAAAGRSKVLHFAIYIPAAAECPLRLQHMDGSLSKTNGFTSPGWGGIVILNPSGCMEDQHQALKHLSVKDLEPVMQLIVAQLRVLFGLPPTASMNTGHDILYVPAISTGFSEWELDVLLRRRAAADLLSFASTLKSLSHLVQSLPNMVIMDEIGDQVRSSLLAAKAAQESAFLGAYNVAADAAQKARTWAEEAFFQPSIMSLLYLPLEHHFAIYTPFFVPVLLHTILAAVKEIRRYHRLQKLPPSELAG